MFGGMVRGRRPTGPAVATRPKRQTSRTAAIPASSQPFSPDSQTDDGTVESPSATSGVGGTPESLAHPVPKSIVSEGSAIPSLQTVSNSSVTGSSDPGDVKDGGVGPRVAGYDPRPRRGEFLGNLMQATARRSSSSPPNGNDGGLVEAPASEPVTSEGEATQTPSKGKERNEDYGGGLPPTPEYAHHHFCPWCDICPTCGPSPLTERTATSVRAPVAPAPVNDRIQLCTCPMPNHYCSTGFIVAYLSPSTTKSLRSKVAPRPGLSHSPALSPLPKLSDVCEACPLCEGANHRISYRRRIQHMAEIEVFCRDNPATVDVADDVTDIDTLANVFTGLVVTDDGPDIRGQQQTPLFSSWNDLRGSLPDVPLAFQPTVPSDVIASIQTLVNAAPIRTAPPTRKERREATLADTLKHIHTAQSTLDFVYELYATNSDHDSTRLALDATAKTVVMAGKLLRSLKASKNDEKLGKMYNEVYAAAVVLHKLVDLVGAVVPKADVEINEEAVEYNTEHHFEDPIAGHDTVAQIVILFTIISNIVIGLATNPCNFLIDTVTLIIKLTMSLSSTPGTEYTAKQHDVLSQLPTTLEDALKMFKLDPKTRILVACPSCHYTHEPQVNRLTGRADLPYTLRELHLPRQG
ncbi:hypothetical protein K438DRAFT_1773544 [Mycena galopus ATCC 62051]|nr:hypothetical protein K438DRAFT_1773544 [Mycena galopus ATCC 62051]